ncbi:MAG TPA: Stp1/IreP family PP2C-type Ser/Thr phosphatase [Accumulibacter sp.]|nr:Stp1/IreP family PP2C-type Ser/Thr phosphatase [Accumulibacter sp.]HMW17692.1 Stp1/IreP family PP2C-type Ser/Thr phosphatase [Accumulibacter sp.]HMX23043.1 Stp1/IreP family PP2C-type Ser/Thr phosphatase [Accumulibacter sp.]HMY07198.1 Stp1/IreP family PP2C-type Ser/Thr phosphatase [Accumulibacter sp.]HNC18865.1 Stp1/IreP family PP2C-type Ser/Thr phosphatase [Accumulibacter sp.]
MSRTTADYSIAAHTVSDIGCVRKSNQDAVAYIVPRLAVDRRRLGVLLIVADGMGGHQGGEVASELAVQTIAESYFAATDEDRRRALEKSIEWANEVVFRASQADQRLAGMGTTVTALALVNREAIFASVGDSRLYRCHNGQCQQLTQDDTLIEQLLRVGAIDADKARNHPIRNILLRSLGTQDTLQIVAHQTEPMAVGEHFVLCSDGLYESIDSDEIGQAVSKYAPEIACRELVELARQRGGRDNISIGVLAICPPVAIVRRQRDRRADRATP